VGYLRVYMIKIIYQIRGRKLGIYETVLTAVEFEVKIV
jgi:hypothetical protein